MRLYGVYCKCSHIDLKCQEYWVHAPPPPHTHSPHVFATGSSDGGVLLCSVEKCSTGRSSQNKQQEESGPLAHSCDLFHLSLSLSFTLLQTVCQAERCLPFIEHFLTPLYSGTLCEGVRNAVSHSLKWPLASWSLPVLTTCVYS